MRAKHAVEGRNQEVDVEWRFLAAGLDRPRRRWKRERFLLRAFQQLARDLLVSAVLLESLPHLVLPAEQLGLLIARRVAG